MRNLFLSLLIIGIGFSGCEQEFHTESKLISVSESYENQAKQDVFKKALTKAGIPFTLELKEGKEFIRYDASHKPAVDLVKDSIFLPEGRHVSFDNGTQAKFKEWLDKNKIPYRTMHESGLEYIVWEASDANRIKEWNGFPPGYENTKFVPKHD